VYYAQDNLRPKMDNRPFFVATSALKEMLDQSLESAAQKFNYLNLKGIYDK
jgi:hypothetical protein